MIDLDKMRAVAEQALEGGPLFVVEIKSRAGNFIEVLIDSDGSVAIDDCALVSRTIEAAFDREEEDYELTVASAGVGQPLRVARQYAKLVGRPVDVVLRDGTRITAVLESATPEHITLAWERKEAVEGTKKKQTVRVVETYPLAEVKTTREFLDFK